MLKTLLTTLLLTFTAAPTLHAQEAASLPATPPASAPAAANDMASPADTLAAIFDAIPGPGKPWPLADQERAATYFLWPAHLTSLSERALHMRAFDDALRHIRKVDLKNEIPGKGALHDHERHWSYFPKADTFREDMAILHEIQPDADAQSFLFFRISFERDTTNKWRVSDETTRHILAFSRLLQQREEQHLSGQDDKRSPLEALAPENLKDRGPLGITWWRWLTLGALIFIGVLIEFFTRHLIGGVFARVAKRWITAQSDETTRTLGRPTGLLLAGSFWVLALPLADFPQMAHDILHVAAAIFAVLSGIWAGWRLIDLLAEIAARKAEQTDTKLDDILVPLVSKALKVVVICIGLIYSAQALGISVVPLLTGLGIGGLAFAFAAKDTIENFFGSVTVILDRPFEVGDWVVIDGSTEGTVEDLGFRSTRIRTFYNSQITVPNATLVRAAVDNYGRRKYRRWKTTLGVQYDTTPEQLVAFTEGIRELVRQHPYTRKDYFQVWCNEFADSSLNILLYIFFETPDWTTELRERERFFVDIVRLADMLGVSFAFPTQTVHLYKEEHTPPQRQHKQPEALTNQRAMIEGIQAAKELVAKQKWQGSETPPPPYHFASADGLLDEAGNATLDENTHDQTKEGQVTRRMGGESGEGE